MDNNIIYIYKSLSGFIKDKIKNIAKLNILTLILIISLIILNKVFSNILLKFITTFVSLTIIITFIKKFNLLKVKSSLGVNTSISSYLFSGKIHKGKEQVKLSYLIIDDFFGSYNNAKVIYNESYLAMKDVNLWLLKETKFLPFDKNNKLMLFIYNKFNLITYYMHNFIFEYIYIKDIDNYWQATVEAIALYVQNFKEIKDSLFKYIYINIISMFILFIISSIIVSAILPSAVFMLKLLIVTIIIMNLKYLFIEPIIQIYLMNNFYKIIIKDEVQLKVCSTLSNISNNYKHLIINITI